MDSTKARLARQNGTVKQCYFENEVGLSSYDLALISFYKNTKKSKSSFNDSSLPTYLI
tara:strand:- start:9 stop:182 length:174 start_codon:yes stop_codon:yes gene_type:complete